MSDQERLIDQLKKLATEAVNPATVDIDRLAPLDIVRRINDEDKKIAGVVELAMPQIAQAAEVFAATLKSGGRVFYIGAGTSGRLGVLDAAECPPTFGTDPKRIIGIISGGHATLILSKEGAEDRRDEAVADLKSHDFCEHDFLIGLAASVRTPYTLAGLEYARRAGSKTAYIICNDAAGVPLAVDIVISLPVGPEAITGSTRMKSATAQKMALNMVSTAGMVLLGKTYGNLMVDLKATSEKLAARSSRMLMELLDLDLEKAEALLEKAGGSVKTAIAMHRLDCSRADAEVKLTEADGFLGRCVE